MEKNIKSDWKKKILLACLLVAIIVCGILITMHNKSSKANIIGGILQEGVIPGYTEEEIKEILQRKADESSFSFEINSRPIFENGDSEGNIRIANPPYNKYYIDVEIKLDSNGETVFKSGEIPPEHYIENAKLSKNLKAGEYEATAIINAYNPENGYFMGSSAAKLIITVKS